MRLQILLTLVFPLEKRSADGRRPVRRVSDQSWRRGIKYPSASEEFGTTIEKGIANVKAGQRYTVDVIERRDGTYVAMNNRTLFCLKKAGVEQIPVDVVRGRWNRKSYDTVRVRGNYHDDEQDKLAELDDLIRYINSL